MRSDMIKVGVDKAPARGLLYATGQVKSAKDMQKPFIAICNSYIDIVPGHVHLRELADIAKEAIRVVNDGTIKFVPERFTKTYINWMENVHDWCISRQLWWGHQIPAWYCDECGHINVKREDPTECEKCGCKHLTREEDVLDTWFSSALWPFSTMGWPDKDAADLNYWYPTSVMVTGYDIIFFWVARMIFSGCEQTKQTPFHTVFIHGHADFDGALAADFTVTHARVRSRFRHCEAAHRQQHCKAEQHGSQLRKHRFHARTSLFCHFLEWHNYDTTFRTAVQGLLSIF